MSDERLEIAVPVAGEGLPLAEFLARRFGYRDRERWARAIEHGEVHVDGQCVGPAAILRAGQSLALTPADRDEDEPRVTVLWQDGHYVAVDKPPECVCHRLSAFPRRTFVRALERELGGATRLEFAHRLDRGTSGVVVLARNPAAVAAFHRMLERHELRKSYLAVVEGVADFDRLTVDEPIGLHPHGVVAAQRALARDGARDPRPAVTVFERIASDGVRTLLRAWPRTGRTHQIRVHLAGLGLPLVGELLYGGDAAAYRSYAERLAQRELEEPTAVARHLLHAESLECLHPITRAPLHVGAPAPADLRASIACAIG